jgi:dUTP pyrophosphatase
MKIKVKKLYQDAQLPEYATDGSGCFDIRAYVPDDVLPRGAVRAATEVGNGDTVVFDTGLSFEIPKGHVMMIYSRSGHGFKNDVRLSNCVGVIDSDYRGELKVKLTGDFNDGENTLLVFDGDRIAQGMVIPVKKIEFEEATKLSTTKRGGKGFGSTGAV